MKSLSIAISEYTTPLQTFIIESVNAIGIPDNPEGFWDWAKSIGKLEKIRKIISPEAVAYLFDMANGQQGTRRMPFVVNYGGNKVFACRRWVETSDPEKLKGFNPNKASSGVYAGLHDTTFNDDMTKASRSDRGLAQEAKDISDILYFCKLAYELSDNEKVDKTKLYKVLTEKDLTRFIEMYEKKAFDTIISAFPEQIEKYGEDNILEPANWTDYIELTGVANTHRNDKGELYDEDFVLNTNDVDDILKNSGRIIADITIYKVPGQKPPKKSEGDPNAKVESDDIYISCRMKSSQLSGVSAKKAMESNKAFIEGMTPVKGEDGVETYPSFASLQGQLKAFIQFWDNFGIDAEEIFNHYQAVEQGIAKDFRPEKRKDYNEAALGMFIRKLVGGNYWYLKPKDCKFVPMSSSDLKFQVTDISISASARTINIKGKINGNLECKLDLRTDNKSIRFPYRIFPVVNVPALIEMCSVDDSKANPE